MPWTEAGFLRHFPAFGGLSDRDSVALLAVRPRHGLPPGPPYDASSNPDDHSYDLPSHAIRWMFQNHMALSCPCGLEMG
jgi:hypothetical protein